MANSVIRLGSSKMAIIAVLVLTCNAAAVPVKTLLAGWQYQSAIQLLDDPDTEELDRLSLTEESYPRYQKARELLEHASSVDPGNEEYPRRLADLLAVEAAWLGVMETVGAMLPRDMMTSKQAVSEARKRIREAILLDPLSPGNHLILARLVEADEWDRSLERAASAYPINSPIRYAVAMEYLQRNNNVQALNHAKYLALHDESYLVSASKMKAATLMRKPPSYTESLGRSYLYKAFEIAWRSADGSPEAYVKAMVPPASPEAQDACEVFLENKGIRDSVGPVRKHR